MLNNTNPGQSVFEPFLGSGTTLIAAETTGRICFAVELDPLYVDVAIRRWQAFTGQQATLAKDGRTFDVTAAGRSAELQIAVPANT
jgi:DNA modification methylase